MLSEVGAVPAMNCLTKKFQSGIVMEVVLLLGKNGATWAMLALRVVKLPSCPLVRLPTMLPSPVRQVARYPAELAVIWLKLLSDPATLRRVLITSQDWMKMTETGKRMLERRKPRIMKMQRKKQAK